MNPKPFARLLLGLFLILTRAATAGDFTLDWQFVSSAPGTSAAGLFSLSGNLRQIDPLVAMSGGNFSLQGGFASAPFSIRLDGSAEISAILKDGHIEVRWSAEGTAGYVLEESHSVGENAVWSPVGIAPFVVGGEKVARFDASQSNRFFRLRRP